MKAKTCFTTERRIRLVRIAIIATANFALFAASGPRIFRLLAAKNLQP